MADSLNSVDGEIDLREIVATLWAHKTLIFLITSLSVFISGYYALTAEKKFTASAIFQIEEANKPGFNIPGEFGALASFAGLGDVNLSSSTTLLEQISAREFILNISDKSSLADDPYFNAYNPDHKDPLWKATIKKLIGWQKTTAEKENIIENNILSKYKNAVRVRETEGGSIILSVTHNNPKKASEYANNFMEEVRKLVDYESKTAQDQRLSYLSETLADALQDMETAQQNLKDYTLKNSAMAQENFISGTLKLDTLRMERRKVFDISQLLSFLDELVKSGSIDDGSYRALRSSNPLVDDVDFRRILGMSETIGAWTWPDIETIEAVSATLRDRIKRLDIEIKEIENNAKIYATSAEDLSKLNRETKIAEATYTVLIEQVKSQSLAAGFQPDTFKVFQYAAPPLKPSSPNRNLVLLVGVILGLLSGGAVALLNSIRQGVYYTRSALLMDARAGLSLRSNRIRRLSKKSISKIISIISNRRILDIDEVEITLANKKLVYVLNCGGRPTASGTARLLATQCSTSGRKVLLCDRTGQSEKETEGKEIHKNFEVTVVKVEDNISVMKEEKGAPFFTSRSFNSTIEGLLDNFDQVFICAKNNESMVGLAALKKFDPSLILLAGLRNTRKEDIKKIEANKPIDILFYD